MEYETLYKLFYKDKVKYNNTFNSRFNYEDTKHLKLEINSNPAFLTINNEILLLISNIYKQNTELTIKTNNLPKIALSQFRIKLLIDEIKLSNDIEGVQSTRKEINDIIKVLDKTEKQQYKRLYGLVNKYIMLSEQKDISISSCKDIRDIYNDLLYNEILKDDKENLPDGIYFRKNSVHIQSPTFKIIHTGTYPEEKIISYLDEALNLLNNEKINKLISTSLFHYLFGYIHPFYDGNGRTSRFISSYLLSKELNSLVGFNLSYTIKQEKNLYYKAFEIVNDKKNKGDITPFIIIFLELLEKAIITLNKNLQNKIEKLEYYNEKINSRYSNKSILNTLFILIQNTLFGIEGLDINSISKIVGLSAGTINNHLKIFKNDNILRITKIGHKKLYDIDLDLI